MIPSPNLQQKQNNLENPTQKNKTIDNENKEIESPRNKKIEMENKLKCSPNEKNTKDEVKQNSLTSSQKKQNQNQSKNPNDEKGSKIEAIENPTSSSKTKENQKKMENAIVKEMNDKNEVEVIEIISSSSKKKIQNKFASPCHNKNEVEKNEPNSSKNQNRDDKIQNVGIEEIIGSKRSSLKKNKIKEEEEEEKNKNYEEKTQLREQTKLILINPQKNDMDSNRKSLNEQENTTAKDFSLIEKNNKSLKNNEKIKVLPQKLESKEINNKINEIEQENTEKGKNPFLIEKSKIMKKQEIQDFEKNKKVLNPNKSEEKKEENYKKKS